MKYFIQLAFAALLLFSVSAALSLWLNQSRQSPETREGEKAAKKGGKEFEPPSEKGGKESKAPGKAEGPHEPSSGGAMAAVREREDRLERRQAQIDLILRDLQSEREAVDALVRQVTSEAQAAAVRVGEAESKIAAAPKAPAGPDPAERKNIEQLARLYDNMAPESAAPIIKQMADSGRMDTAVRILAQMRDRQAAQLLAALSDPSLAAQLTEKVRQLKRAAAGGATPAGGTTTPGAGPSLAPPPSPVPAP